jgi:hypothetical protein
LYIWVNDEQHEARLDPDMLQEQLRSEFGVLHAALDNWVPAETISRQRWQTGIERIMGREFHWRQGDSRLLSRISIMYHQSASEFIPELCTFDTSAPE